MGHLMYTNKKFLLSAEQIQSLLPPSMGSGLATDRIMVDGKQVGIMYRERAEEAWDSGWVFLAGDETQEYVDNPKNWAIYKLNTIANYDRAIIPYLVADIGADFERIIGTDSFRRSVE